MHCRDPAKFWGGEHKKKSLIYFCALLICGVGLQKKVVAWFGTSEENVVLLCPFKGLHIYHQSKLS